MPNESATARLGRLLTMVPWLMNRQGIDIDEAARELGVSRQQIEADLELLFVCGTPGHLPDDLIEAEWEGGKVFLRNADTIARPLRLGLDEALALIVGLRTLAAVPGLGERDAVDRALAKLTGATGGVEGADRIRVAPTADDAAARWLQPLQGAVRDRHRVHLSYLVASRDETTDRDVDPMRVFLAEGQWYLEGWCHRAEAVRLFRLDRIDDLQVLDTDGTPPPEATARDLDAAVFQPAPDDYTATLSLQREAAWVADYYPTESVESAPDGSLTVRLRTGDLRWLRQLVWRLGGSARVLAPQELRDDVIAGAQEALAAYET
ncbi:WYL domain-containing protein [Calidifontibacter sp. DB0510]|uniref:WYL domain-containing protein n=1 Tax=Metallococcus carri TaxID=1656884 RepID=A0A967AXH7_9MICO|nr:WYL domain-containing protein [Metallococcus carri]NHN54801.1 WYL domain-containing protein [Metallococcus carri]NOP37146.1 WYL domain-containing protein [Calidifontibacter sp. DB2511S]